MKALILAVVALGLAATGCTLPEPSGTALPPGEALPPPPGVEEPTGVAKPTGEAGTGGGGEVVETIPAEPPAAKTPSEITVPSGGWSQAGVPLTRRQADFDSCFTFAKAQIARESQIDQDRLQGGDDRRFENQYGEATLTQRLDFYSERQRRDSLFASCMRSKGYVKN